MDFFIIGRLVWRSELSKEQPAKHNQQYSKCFGYLSVLKTNCPDFEFVENNINLVAWKEVAETLAPLRFGRSGHIIEVFFNKQDYRDGTNLKKEPIKVVRPRQIIPSDHRAIERYSINSEGQFDPYTRMVGV